MTTTTALPLAGALAGGEELVMNQGGRSKRMPLDVAIAPAMTAAGQASAAAGAVSAELRSTVNKAATNDVADAGLLYFVDALNRVLGRVNTGADWDIVLTALKSADGTNISTYETTDATGPLVIVDANRRILWTAGQDSGNIAALATALGGVQASVAAATATAGAAADQATSAGVKADQALAQTSAIAAGFTNDATALVYFVDAVGRVLGSIGQDGGWEIALKALAASDGTKLYSYDTNDASLGPLVIVDANGRILWSAAGDSPNLALLLAEVVAARGSQASLDARLSKTLTAYGAPKVPAWGQAFMRNSRRKLTMRALGEAAQLIIAAGPGDSYTQNASRWSGPFAAYLVGKYGDAGGGWTGFGFAGNNPGAGATQPTLINGNVRPATYPVTFFGAAGGGWVKTYNASPSPDCAHVTSVTAGDKLTIGAPALPVHNAVTLFFIGSADGVMRYRWNGGAWTNINLQGTVGVLQTVDLVGVPVGAFTLELETVSGAVSPCGVDLKSAASGVRIHKLGGSGSQTTNWTDRNAAQQQSGWAALGIEAFILFDGTNTQTGGTLPATQKTNQGIMIDRMRAAVPFPDILIVAPPENQRATNVYPMSAYAAVGLELAMERSCAFKDMQPDFGLNAADYAATSANPLFNADLIHPEPATGGRQLLAGILPFVIPFA